MNMKRIWLLFAALCCAVGAFSQAKKPTLMVVPGDVWCNENGFVKHFDNMGENQVVPDYVKAFQNSGELKVAITTIGSMMQQRGFPLKDMEQTVKSLANASAEDMATTSKNGEGLAESPLDLLKKRAKSDIILELYWKVNKIGMRKSLTFNLRALDAYTNKQVGALSGTTEPTISETTELMLQGAVEGGMDQLNSELMTYFTDMANKGREVALNIKVWNDSPKNLEDDLNGGTLADFIEEWVSNHTVNKSFSLLDATENMMNFEQVRIPLYLPGTEVALDTRRWAKDLSKELAAKGIANKLMMKGLGEATIVIGGK